MKKNKTQKRRSEKREKELIDKLIYITGILSPLILFPQLATIWIEKNASGVSIFSWSAYLFVAVFWLIYSKIHKLKPIMFTYTIWIILDTLIIIGVTKYS